MPYVTFTQKKIILIACLILIIGSGIAYATYKHFQTSSLVESTPVATLAPKRKPVLPTASPEPAFSHINGLAIDPSKLNQAPLAVMIENHPAARPQAGLAQADLVYEAIAEGGITRFMAVFGDASHSVKVGPIRSARTYFVDLATELHAFYAHVGGNADALDQISATHVPDLDQFGIGEPVYKREFTRPVALEHTMYSTTDKLWNFALGTRHFAPTASVQPWQFQDDPPLAQRPTTQKVHVAVSDSLYTVNWTYSPDTNSYSREMAGSAHTDAVTGEQIKAKTIILQTVERRKTLTRSHEDGWIYTLTGSGSAIVIKNGTAIKGTWAKQGTERTRFYDSNNHEIPLTRGKVWVHLVHSDSTISY